jgi:hypothetical protein
MENGEDLCRIFIESSEPNTISDEYVGAMIDNLSGRQLNAVAEVAFATQKQIGGSDKIPDEDKKGEEDHPPKQQTERSPQQKRKWTPQDISANWPFNMIFLFHLLKCLKFSLMIKLHCKKPSKGPL